MTQIRHRNWSASKCALAAAGAGVLRGTLDVLRNTAAAADAVIHTAFSPDFSKFVEGCEQDRRVIEVLGSALEGSDRPLLVTMGIAMLGNIGSTAWKDLKV